MTFTPEQWLALLLVALYVNDALAFVPANEAWLERGPLGGWRALLPTRRFTLGGRHLLIAGVAPPWTPVFRLHWASGAPLPECAGWEAAAERLRIFQWLAGAIFILVVIALPVALLARAGDTVVLALGALAYGLIVVGCIALWRRRSTLQLEARACLHLAFEMLVCPPIAANLVRRLSLAVVVPEDFTAAAHRLLAPPRWAALRETLRTRIGDELELHAPDSAEFARLVARRESLP